jgi:hypothetical protein
MPTTQENKNTLASFFFDPTSSPDPRSDLPVLGLFDPSSHDPYDEARALVTGIALGYSGTPAQETILIYVEPVPDCELNCVRKAIKDKVGECDYLLLKSGRFIGLTAPSSPYKSISPSAPFNFNVPPAVMGSFGAFVAAGGKDYVLSCNHVLAFNGRAPFGTPVVSPCTLDDPGAPPIASLSHYVPFQDAVFQWPTTGGVRVTSLNSNVVDCALAEWTGPVAPVQSASVMPTSAVPGMIVHKAGRTSGETSAQLSVLQWTGPIDFSFGTFYLDNLPGTVGSLLLGHQHPDRAFAAPGDSGSLVHGNSTVGAVITGLGLVTARAYAINPVNKQFEGYHVLWSPLEAIQTELSTRALPAPLPANLTFFW